MKFLTRHFFRGILFLAPITLTIYIIYTIFEKVDRMGHRVLGAWLGEGTFSRGAGFLLTIAIITAIGYLSSLWLGSVFLGWIEKQFIKSTFLKGIYGTIRETFNVLFGEKKFASRGVLVTFPELGYKKMGFVTQDSLSFLTDCDDRVAVYFPHSFQVSGELLIVPKKNVQFLDLPSTTLFKMILSGGIVKD